MPDSTSVIITRSQLSAFIHRCGMNAGRSFADWNDFHKFSTDDFRTFWQLLLDWSDLAYDGDPQPVCDVDDCEKARFFPNIHLSYVENLLGGAPEAPGLIARSGSGQRRSFTRGALRMQVLRLAAALDGLGVRAGDRVVCIARNGPEAIVAALAAAAVGAIFSSCGPEMGAFSMLSRFAPLTPVVLFANTRTEAWDVGEPLAQRVAETVAGLPSLLAVVGLDDGKLPDNAFRLADLIATVDPWPSAPARPFNQPLFAMFSSGTTGAPKCILHGAGGTLLEHVKEHRLHCDLRPGERLFFQSSCGWMMWNWQLSALASGVELVLYDGVVSPPDVLWRIVAEEQVNVFGTSPAYLRLCEDLHLSPRRDFDLGALRAVLSTGSILYPRQFDWVADNVGPVALQSISGGTDIIGCFVLGNPDLPVRRGEAQCRSLGMDVRALAEPGTAVGELVCANPFPSRPIGLWDDPDGSRFHVAYFAQNLGFWTHGDLIEITPSGGAIMHGRSDGILKIRGVRVGPAEIYAALQDVPEIAEAMAIGQDAQDEPGGVLLVLLVVLRPGEALDRALVARIRATLLERGAAVMVPSRVLPVSALPETHSGKRSEAAAAAALNGRPVHNRAALRNAEVLEEIAAQAARADPAAAGSLTLDAGLEDALQAVCEVVLGVAPIGHSDDLFDLTSDSLASLRLLLEIERRTGKTLPFEAMMSARTIAQLAAVLRGDERLAAVLRGDQRPAAAVAVREVVRRDIPAVCALLQQASDEGTFEPISAAAWRRIFEYPWLEDKPDLGFVLTDGNAVVGFLGTIYARRVINGVSGVVCNLTSWYVRPGYRGWGSALLRAALRDDVSYTSLSPTAVSQQALAMMGFSPMCLTRFWLPPGLHADTLRHPRPRILTRPDQVRAALSPEQRRIFDDHAPHCLQLVVRDGDETAYIVATRRVRRRPLPSARVPRLLHRRIPIPYSELLYCSAPELLARHLERIKLAVLWRQRSLFLVGAARFFPVPPRGLERPDVALFRSPVFDGAALDRLYSEFLVLSI
jgi:acetoacetyl-CoA synthetase